MGILQRLFGTNVAKLEERRDVAGLTAAVSSDGPPELRVSAIEALTRLEEVSAAPLVAAALSDAEAAVAKAAAAGLRAFGPAAAGALIGVLDREAGARALELLLELGDDAAEPLREAAGAPEEATRRRALEGLLELEVRTGSSGVRETVFRSLLAALGDGSPSCRVLAASGLEGLADDRAAKALASQLKDGDDGVRSGCSAALAAIGEPAVPNLVDALYDRNANSRRLAAGLLGEVCGTGCGIEVCREALSGLMDHAADKDGETARAVRNALEMIPAAAVLEDQLEMLADPERSDRTEILEFVRGMLQHAALDDRQRANAVRRIENIGFSLGEEAD